MAGYVDLDDMLERQGIDDTVDSVAITAAIESASRWIDHYCGRYFGTTTSQTREFYPDDAYMVRVDDISTTSGLVVATDNADDGTYSTTWTISTDFLLEPVNAADQVIAEPYTRIRAVGSRTFPATKRPAVRVTALFGWPAVPDGVKEACKIQAHRLLKRKDSPEGVLGGFEAFGPVRVGTRTDPDVQALLDPYRRGLTAVMLA